MRYHSGSIGLFFLFLIFGENLFAGAWTQRKDHSYFQLSGFHFDSRAVFDSARNSIVFPDNGRFTEGSAYAYLEYGLSDVVTFVGKLAYKNLRFQRDSSGTRSDRKNNGWGDVYFGVRYLLSNRGPVTSLQVGFKINTGYEADPQNLNAAPPLGDGQNDFEVRALIGQSIFRYAAYYNIDIGYRVRNGAPVDEIPFEFELGAGLGKAGLLIGKLYGVHALAGVEAVPIRQLSQTSLNPVEDYVKARGELNFHLRKGMDVVLIYESLWSGRNTADGRSFGVALSFYSVPK
jgi:hypothetical protein